MKTLFKTFGLLIGSLFVILVMSVILVAMVRAEQVIYPNYNLPGTLEYSIQQQTNIQREQLELQKEQIKQEKFDNLNREMDESYRDTQRRYESLYKDK